jgi:Dolichyl-phosphate-mannose-protein mannosyltransferase
VSVYASLLLAHLPAFLIGLALVELFWPRRGRRDGYIKLALAPGLGWGISSCLYFFWCFALGPTQPGYNILEWGLALGMVLAAFLAAHPKRWEWRELIERLTFPPTPLTKPAALLPGAAALLGFLLLAGLLWLRSSTQPNGNFDAYAIWNLRARFLFLTRASDWTVSFSPQLSWWTHPDYPLLWPLTLLRGYLSQGRLLTQAAVFQAVVFAIALGGLFIAGLARSRDFWQAALGALLLLGLPWFINFSAFQQSDVPLVFFYLAFILLLLLAQDEPHPGLLVLAGLATGCAAWTKNEGLVFVIAALVSVLFYAFRSPRPTRLARLTAFAAGLLLPMTTVFLFKLFLATPGDLIGVQTNPELLAKVLDPTRYAAILSALLRQLPSLGGLTWPAIVALAASLLLAGLATRRPPAWLFLPLTLTLLGYCAVYLITPHPLAWHLGYSLDRLVFHLLIPALFLLLARARSPKDLFRAVRGSESQA